jgi:NCS1 family nucleobase:cation symporter-1
MRGANLPAVLRALVACGWFGIQAWIGGDAIHRILGIVAPSLASGHPIAWLGISGSQLACFLVFWAVNMVVVYRGIETIRLLLSIKAPLLILLGIAFVAWAHHAAGGFGLMLSQPSAFEPGQPKAGGFVAFFIPALTGMIGFWATLSLNIPDFSRYASSQRAQVVGQAVGLPLAMAFYSFIGVAVTSATVVIFGRTIWDPLDVLVHFTNPAVLILAMVALCIATLATNIAANVVSPANDFAQLAPRWISFRTGGLITGFIGILIMPWKLVADPSGYIFTWLLGYSGLLGPVGGIMIADYFVLRRRTLDVGGLYDPRGPYRYSGGWSVAAVAAFLAGALPSVPGFLAQVGLIAAASVPQVLLSIYSFAWFAGFAIAFVAYLLLRKLAPNL